MSKKYFLSTLKFHQKKKGRRKENTEISQQTSWNFTWSRTISKVVGLDWTELRLLLWTAVTRGLKRPSRDELGGGGRRRRTVPTSAVRLHIGLRQLTRMHAERVIGHDELNELVMHFAADYLVVDVRDEIVGAQTRLVRRALLVHMQHQMLNRERGRVIREDFDRA